MRTSIFASLVLFAAACSPTPPPERKPGDADLGTSAGPPPTSVDLATDDTSCGGQQFAVTRVQPNVFLVIDRSGSMISPISGTSGTSKWSDLKTAVGALVTGYDSQIRLGMSMFAGDSDCGPGKIDTALAPANGAMVNSLLAASSPLSETPTATTLDNVIKSGGLTDTTRDNVVVLATDGLPNCGDIDVTSRIAKLYAQTPSVKTYVIGVGDGTESAPDTLNAWAVAGHTDRTGTTKYYQSDSPSDLQTAFSTIAGGVVSCTFQLSSTPPDPTQLYVYLNQTKVALDATNGYSYSDGPPQITLNGTSCDTLKSDATQKVQIVYGCPTPPPIN